MPALHLNAKPIIFVDKLEELRMYSTGQLRMGFFPPAASRLMLHMFCLTNEEYV